MKLIASILKVKYPFKCIYETDKYMHVQSFTCLRKACCLIIHIFFTATEYRNWLFHYSIPCLVGVLPDVYLHHFMLLAFGVWLVNQQTISPEEVYQSGNLLAKFVMLIDALYGGFLTALFELHIMYTVSVKGL